MIFVTAWFVVFDPFGNGLTSFETGQVIALCAAVSKKVNGNTAIIPNPCRFDAPSTEIMSYCMLVDASEEFSMFLSQHEGNDWGVLQGFRAISKRVVLSRFKAG